MPCRRYFLVACFCYSLFVGSCKDTRQPVQGRWIAEQTPAIALYFYPDGTVSLSGTNFLRLEWKQVDDKLIRIDALDRKVISHFKLTTDQSGIRGTLELAGYDTLVFRKRD